MTAFEVALCEADLVQAFRVNARRTAVRPLACTAILVALSIVLLLAVSPAARHSFTSWPLSLLPEGALVTVAMQLLLVVLARPAIIRVLARRTPAQHAELAGPIH
jgi:hypothetical protein